MFRYIKISYMSLQKHAQFDRKRQQIIQQQRRYPVIEVPRNATISELVKAANTTLGESVKLLCYVTNNNIP